MDGLAVLDLPATFDDFLRAAQPEGVELLGKTYDAATALKRWDPTDYKKMRSEWLADRRHARKRKFLKVVR